MSLPAPSGGTREEGGRSARTPSPEVVLRSLAWTPVARAPPADATPLGGPTSVKQLPNELILVIIRAGLPPIRDGTFGERNRLLRTWSCVTSRSWAALAQTELYRHVSLPTTAIVNLFATSSNTSNIRKARFRHTHTLRIGRPRLSGLGGEKPVLGSMFGLLLSLCTSLKELRITGIWNLDYGDLSIAVGLTSLYLDNVHFRPKDHYQVYLPKLKAISLNSIFCRTPDGDPSTVDDFLNPKSLPSLTHLAWRYYPTLPSEHLSQYPLPTFSLIAPQIETLFLGRHMSQDFYDAFLDSLPLARNLQHLTLDAPELLPNYAAIITSRLRSLQIGMLYFRARPISVDEHVLAVLHDAPRCLERLEKLSLPEVFFYGWTRRLKDKLDKSIPEVQAAWNEREALAALCSAREVELVVRPLTEDGEDLEVGDWRECVE
ncbi:hypothetical protein RQP46_002600 [Phenoliferia psychrophenolica]